MAVGGALAWVGCVAPEDWCDRFGLECETESAPEPPVDADGDVWAAEWDCDDENPDVYPGAQEVCNEVDDDCDGEVDEGFDKVTAAPDADGDGWGDADAVDTWCVLPDGYVVIEDDEFDCDDGDPEVNPGVVYDQCDGVDRDCDGYACDVVEVDDVAGVRVVGRDASWCEGLAAGEPAGDGETWVAFAGEDVVAVLPWSELDGDEPREVLEEVAPLRLEIGAVGSASPGAMAVALADLDQDGFDDLVVAIRERGGHEAELAVFAGPALGTLTPDDADAELIVDEDPVTLFASATSDVTGDGVPDVLSGGYGSDYDGLRVVAGPGLSGGSWWLDSTSFRAEDEVRALVPGDVNGDGIGDLVVASPSARTTDEGGLWVLPGPVGPDTDIDEDAAIWLVWTRSARPRIGEAVAAPGDVDGDGLADLLLSAPSWSVGEGAGTVFLIRGEQVLEGGVLGVVDDRLEASDGAIDVGERLAMAGDVDGDGADELAVTLRPRLEERRAVILVPAAWEGVVETRTAPLWLHDGESGTFGESLLGVPAVDGAPWLVVGEPEAWDDGALGVGWVLPADALVGR